MLTALLVTALLTCATLAQAASAALTVDATPAGTQVSCDIGPPATVPAKAAAAGFTHCVANFDFSQPTYAVPGWDLAAPADQHWMDCQGEYPNALWHTGSTGVEFWNPCDIHQVTDSLTGQKVMRFEWLPIYDNRWGAKSGIPQANQVGIQTASRRTAANNYTNIPTLSVGNYHVETVNRIERVYTEAQNAGGPDAVYLYSSDPYHEVDVVEHQTNDTGHGGVVGMFANCANAVVNPRAPWSNSGFCATNWGPNLFVGVPGYTDLVYHKYAALRTSDGKTDTRVCMFLEDVMQGPACGPVLTGYAGSPVDTTFNDRSIAIA